MRSGFFRADDGLSLYYRAVRSASAKASVVFVHGVGEHIGRYQSAFDWLAARGYDCFGHDQRGFGRSEGVRGDVAEFSRYVADLETFLTEVVLKATDQPIVLFGHSMGSIVVLTRAMQTSPPCAGLMVFSCPLAVAQWSGKLGAALAGPVHHLLPGLMMPNFINPNALTNDPEVVDAFRDDPYVFGKVSVNWLYEFARACRTIMRDPQAISLPILIAHGSHDRIADARGAKWLFENIGSADKHLEIFEGFRHELLNHIPVERALVLECMYRWLEQHFKQRASVP